MWLRQAALPDIHSLPRRAAIHCHAGQQQPGLTQRSRLPETDIAKSCQHSDQVGRYLVAIHQMTPPEHTSINKPILLSISCVLTTLIKMMMMMVVVVF